MADYVPSTVYSTIGINAELTKVAAALKRKISSQADESRFMEADLDMNSNRILNLPKPVSWNEPVRLKDIVNVEEIIAGSTLLYSKPVVNLVEGITYFNPETFSLTFSYNDGDTSQYVTFPLVQGDASGDTFVGKTYNPLDYGAVGNGIVNDLPALQAAANAARDNKGVLIIPAGGYTFGINGYLLIHNGVKAVLGYGSRIKNIAGPLYSGVMLQGKNGGRPENVYGCRVSGLIIDQNNLPGTGIFMENASSCIIEGNKILNVKNGYGILSRCFDAGLSDATNNIIVNNEVFLEAVTGVASFNDTVYGIELSSTFDYSPYSTAPEYWKANFVDKTPMYVNAYSIVTNNRISGGYYGLSLSGARYCNFSGNVTSQNMRGISIQHTSLTNMVSRNLITDCVSSGISMSYNASFNTITSNEVYTTKAAIQALLSCYVGCTSNKFSTNQLHGLGSSNPNWYIYCGVNSSLNVFDNNSIRGNCQKAYICCESAWDNTLSEASHYAYGEPADVNFFANTSTFGNSFLYNSIEGDSAVPGIVLTQVTDSSGTWNLERIKVIGNVFLRGTHNFLLKLVEETSGALTNCTLMNNDFWPISSSAKFVLPRGKAHFYTCTGNTWLNDTTFIEATLNSTTPSVALRDYISLSAYSTPTNVTNFTDGFDGQEIVVRLSTNVTLVHNTSVMRLKGNVNAAGGSSDNTIRLKRTTGIWIEMGRSF